MAKKDQKIEYGFVIAPIGTVDNENSITKKSFLERVEAEYPSAEGWEVFDTQTYPNPNQTYTLAYHLKRVNG